MTYPDAKIIEFCQEIENMSFDDKPDYDNLKDILKVESEC